MSHAIGVIHQENGTFGISFPDFPGCISTAETLDEVVLRGGQALAFHVEGMAEDEAAFPHLRSLSELQADETARQWVEGGVLAAVPVDLPGRAVRVNISMDEHLLDRIDRAARALGQSRSAYLADAAKRRMAEAQTRAA